jgi:hypothetical protein
MKLRARLVLLFGSMALAISGVWYWQHLTLTAAMPAAPTVSANEYGDEDAQYPIPARQETSRHKGRLKSENKKDRTLSEALAELFGMKPFVALFNNDDLAYRIAVTIENLRGTKQPRSQSLPVKSPESDFMTKDSGGKTFIGPENARRYLPYVDLIRSVDPEKIADLYIEFYPVLQAAYSRLGTRKYFNDRVVQAIDELLAAPDATASVEVARGEAGELFHYVDDHLESLPSSRKILVRMGQDNAAVIKSKLRAIRAIIAKPKSSPKA